MRIKTPVTTLAAASAILILIFSVAAIAIPEKLDKYGCAKCTADCEKRELLNNEYFCIGTVSAQSQNIQIAPRIYGDQLYRRVASVIDGDTLVVYYGANGRKEKVRLLGIDTPETSPKENPQCYSAQATQQLNKLTFNKFVLLKKDKLQKEDKDKYGRLLRYVVLFDNTTVNEELIKGGYAKAYPVLTTTVEKYKGLENEAKAKKLGMWDECFREKKNQKATGIFPQKGERVGVLGEHA